MDKTVNQILDEVTTEMCGNYCKMPEKWQQEHGELKTNEECDAFWETVCVKCPLNKL